MFVEWDAAAPAQPQPEDAAFQQRMFGAVLKTESGRACSKRVYGGAHLVKLAELQGQGYACLHP